MPRLVLSLVIVLLCIAPAHAAPSLSAARSEARNLAAKEKSFARTLSRISAANRIKLKALLGKTGGDSDNDGVSDIFEKARGSNLCNADSDGDGITDDKDNNEDAEELEVKGPVVSFDGTSLVVGTTTFIVNTSTTLRPPNLTITAGICVEVEGHKDGTSNIADKVKKEDCADD